ncbi:acyl-CoA thioesterase II [Microbacterium sediminicola]|uniref:Acyl-CoA thioesterase II n=1 Tax=Microbacterium sediminicola TaxID=415210 RepID=A0ABP4TQH3_9MICO
MSSAPFDPHAALLSALQLSATSARTTEDIFTAVSLPMPGGRIFGGQVLAQAVVAASRTIPDDRPVHSMHGYFLRPGDATQGVTLSVDRIHDGRSFSTRRTQAFQDGVPIFSMIASFQVEGPGLEHQEPMPAGIPRPDAVSAPEPATLHPMSQRVLDQSPIETRHVEGTIFNEVPARAARQHVWLRARTRLPDDPAVHRAALAFMSDMTIQEPVLRAHGVPWAQPRLRVASLDHAMWWHRDARADEWLLFAQDSPSSRGGRGLAHGRLYTQDGMLVATVAQEIMARVPDPE